MRQPILTNEDLEKIRMIGEVADNHFRTQTLDMTFAVDRNEEAMAEMVDRLCQRAPEYTIRKIRKHSICNSCHF